jgi:HNH endonuclease
MSRADIVRQLLKVVGAPVRPVKIGSGWPSIVDVQTTDGQVRVALHLGKFAERSYRGRDLLERRMQNPGQNRPITRDPSAIPIVIGLWEGGGHTVLAGFDARGRVGRVTRQSFFAALPHLRVADREGWTSYRTGSEEEVFAFWPEVLPAYVEMVARGLEFDPGEVAGILSAAGLNDDGKRLLPAERMRRMTKVLVRRAAFSKDVVDAYGTICAMCGLNFGLVQGAHIYPVSAPESPDHVQNGLALCANHHAAFDRHLVYVAPESRRLQLHPRLINGAHESEACKSFVAGTFEELRTPADPRHRPHPEMFRRRYAHYEDAYKWSG